MVQFKHIFICNYKILNNYKQKNNVNKNGFWIKSRALSQLKQVRNVFHSNKKKNNKFFCLLTIHIQIKIYKRFFKLRRNL